MKIEMEFWKRKNWKFFAKKSKRCWGLGDVEEALQDTVTKIQTEKFLDKNGNLV